MLQKNGGEIRLGDVVIEGAATEDDGRLAYWVQFLVPADHAERQRFHIDNSNLFGEAHQKRAGGDEVPFEPLKSRTVQGAAGMLISIPDDRAIAGVDLKPSLELGLLRSEVLAARGYSEVDGDRPAVHPAIMYDSIGRSNRALWGSQKPKVPFGAFAPSVYE